MRCTANDRARGEDTMRTGPIRRAAAVAGSVVVLASGTALTSAAASSLRGNEPGDSHVRHVLLISVDGLHQQDLTWYVHNYPSSTLAALVRTGVDYRNAMTPVPSDSSPGMVAQTTGGNPGVTGIYYDDTWNRDLFPAGTTNCSGPVPGGEVAYHEAVDINQHSIDAGQGLSGLPGSILQMTANPLDVISPANLPVDPATCKPIYPNQYLQVNTIFEIARQHGLRTAWSDKHPAFLTVSTAEKLPTSDGLTGGYLPGGTIPGPLLVRALNYINTEVGAMVSEIRAQGLAASTAIIISAKHGQSPTNPSDLARVPDGPIISTVNAAWTAAHPGAGDLVIFATDDDGMLLWLSDRSQAAADFVKSYLLSHTAAGNDINGSPITVSASGLAKVYADEASADYFGVASSDPRHPDVFAVSQHGVVYTGGKGKIAEHGGAGFQDRNVPILVALPGPQRGRTVGNGVETTQIAPTILALLGLDPHALQAVQIEHTRVLPGLPQS